MLKFLMVLCLLFRVSEVDVHAVDSDEKLLNKQIIGFEKQTIESSKKLLIEGEFEKARDILEELIDPNRKVDEYTPFALFYYALANYNLNEIEHAESIFYYIFQNFEDWEKNDELKYWISRVLFEQQKYLEAIQTLKNIEDKEQIKLGKKLKSDSLKKIKSPLTFYELLLENPDDKIILKMFSKRILEDPYIEIDNHWVQNILKKFKIDLSKLNPLLKLKSIKKDEYNIAVMLPILGFQVLGEKVENNFIFNLYKGIHFAISKLNQDGKKFNLYLYDTKKDIETTKKILEQEEMKSMDLIIGPLYPETVKIASDFAKINQINMINPLSTNSEIIKRNPFIYLFKSSSETQAKKAAEYTIQKLDKESKNIAIIYDKENLEDIKRANTYKELIEKYSDKKIEINLGLTHLEAIDFLNKFRESSNKQNKSRQQIENEEKQKGIFDDIDCMYVASNNKLIVGSILSIVEMRNLKFEIIGNQKWLQSKTIDFDKFEKFNLIMIAPQYIEDDSTELKKFRLEYYKKYKQLPDLYSYLGYELINFFGEALLNYGIYFQNEWKEFAENYHSKLINKIQYYKSQDNQSVELIRIKEGKCVVEELEKFNPYV